MKLEILPDKDALGVAASAAGASVIRDAIARRGESTIIVATGASQFEMLDRLVEAEGIDWSKVTAFHLDEYVGLPESHPASFRRYLRERFVARLPALKAFVPVDGDAEDIDAEVARLNARLGSLAVDVCFAGIGENCHLAFNDPPADFATEAPYLVVELDEACRRQQLGEGWFATLADVPPRAISMSIRQMMKSRALIVSVPDPRKAEAVKAAVEGDVSPQSSGLDPSDARVLHALSRSRRGLAPRRGKRVKAREEERTTPGLFDLQVNGFAGSTSTMRRSRREMLDHALKAMRATGVTRCLPTMITAHPDALDARFEALDRAVADGPARPGMCPGYHLEGPFLNPAEGYRGCHPHEAMTAADPALVERLEAGLVAADPAGHAGARGRGGARAHPLGKQARQGRRDRPQRRERRGPRRGGRGRPCPLDPSRQRRAAHLHKLDNTIFAQLAEDRLFADFIADGIHIPPQALKVLLRAKGVERSILVTDAVSAAARRSVGSHPFAGFTIELRRRRHGASARSSAACRLFADARRRDPQRRELGFRELRGGDRHGLGQSASADGRGLRGSWHQAVVPRPRDLVRGARGRGRRGLCMN